MFFCGSCLELALVLSYLVSRVSVVFSVISLQLYRREYCTGVLVLFSTIKYRVWTLAP
jgi:hypothetical protein